MPRHKIDRGPMDGQELRDIQREFGLKNQAFAEAIGVTEATLCNWIAGRVMVPRHVAISLRVLRAHPEDIPDWC